MFQTYGCTRIVTSQLLASYVLSDIGLVQHVVAPATPALPFAPLQIFENPPYARTVSTLYTSTRVRSTRVKTRACG